MENVLYPAPPVYVPVEKLTPSAAFKKQAIRVIASIVLFLIVYGLLLTAAGFLAMACYYAGIWTIVTVPKLVTIAIGAGLIAFGSSVVYFLLKFMFSVTKDQNTNRIEITEQEQPKLFAFIRQLTKDTNTHFPGRIFVSPDVNAYVFYNSSFWSMFLPIRKNLNIGIGLVNSVNISEFKAVMAHEFGHFSQRSMKLGSFTYNTNRIIYNMLYENTSYTSFLQSWGNIHGILSLFALLTFKIANGIQLVLREMYKIINKSYFSLSREMEFHADTIAASVAGGNNLVTALSRIEFADNCYNAAINSANVFLKEKKKARNIFSNQLTLFRSLADEHQLPLKQGLPEISYQFVNSFSKSRINFKNQWASHPTLEERKQNLEYANMDVAPDETSAWVLFTNAEALQETLTANLYSELKPEDELLPYDHQEFDSWHAAEREKYKLPAAYKGFYKGRYINTDDWDFTALTQNTSTEQYDQLFTDENSQMESAVEKNLHDIEIVKAIREKQIDVVSFDFDGTKYTRADCDQVIAQLETDVLSLKEKQLLADKQAFTFFYQHSSNRENLLASYQVYHTFRKQHQEFMDVARAVAIEINKFYADTPTLDEVNAALRNIEVQEIIIKKTLRKFITSEIIRQEPLQQRINAYINSQYVYFKDGDFLNEELNEVRYVITEVLAALETIQYSYYKKMLEDQLSLLHL